MYCHDLRASFGGAIYTIPCEDTPVGDSLVGIWPYDLQLDPSTYSSLIQALHEWATNEGFFCRIYIARDRFESDGLVISSQAEQAASPNRSEAPNLNSTFSARGSEG